ncbi:probable 54S ribosomal protein L7, mitochondrial [Saccharomycodes ludwigii]|uniref:Large ribosomal subunit protein uL5m n=1 Tax=Saccharomycodes ludwigii TaxID=36035 RepID=A0A376B593_9ASCO|nr:hypothetical protein SCDLUD_001930 [Saccharomycodes ludwigii]KAH3902117.1 hypothetical protein SCDLUD_001930 [Saccharomycodes ludwigii]SSD59759.1 probable 54S ribosomal protein L7, mitochondrial [Saccharomycodes ludwigii]
MFIRSFSTCSKFSKAACSIVQPVHHKVKINKLKLTPRFPELKYEKNDIRSPRFKPTVTHQDRVKEHYYNTLQSDLLLINYKHNTSIVKGSKIRKWDGSSPYHINRPPARPAGLTNETPDIKPISPHNIPEITGIVINCYVSDSKENQLLPIAAKLQLQQITGVKPETLYAKTDVPSWGVRRGNPMGAKVILKGRPLSQFISTLTEIVLPRIREYKGIRETSGDKNGNIAFGLTPEDVKYFPEIDANHDLWPKTFGMHITMQTSAQTDEHAKTLISGLGFPFTNTKRAL